VLFLTRFLLFLLCCHLLFCLSSNIHKLFDVSSDEEMSVGAFQIRVHPDDQEQVRQNRPQTTSNGVQVRTAYRVVHRNGTVLHLDSRGETSMGADGVMRSVDNMHMSVLSPDAYVPDLWM